MVLAPRLAFEARGLYPASYSERLPDGVLGKLMDKSGGSQTTATNP